MRLIDIYTDDLNTYTFREFVLEYLNLNLEYETVEEYYERIANDTGIPIDRVLDILHERERATDDFYEKVEKSFGIGARLLKSYQKKKDKIKELKRRRRARKSGGAGQISPEMWKQRGDKWRRKLNMVGKIIEKHGKHLGGKALIGKIAETMGISPRSAKTLMYRYNRYRRMMARFGVMDTTPDNARKLFAQGCTIPEINALLGMSEKTIKKMIVKLALDEIEE